MSRVGVVVVLERVDESDRASTDNIRHGVCQELPAHDEHAGSAGATDELVRRQENRVFAGGWLSDWVHVDRDVWPCRGEIPERERAVLMEDARKRDRVTQDSGDIARGAERTDLERPVGETLELGD
jgi:hypothetical protein